MQQRNLAWKDKKKWYTEVLLPKCTYWISKFHFEENYGNGSMEWWWNGRDTFPSTIFLLGSLASSDLTGCSGCGPLGTSSGLAGASSEPGGTWSFSLYLLFTSPADEGKRSGYIYRCNFVLLLKHSWYADKDTRTKAHGITADEFGIQYLEGIGFILPRVSSSEHNFTLLSCPTNLFKSLNWASVVQSEQRD